MTTPNLQLSVSQNTSDEAHRLEAEIAALQLKINNRGGINPKSSSYLYLRNQISTKQSRLLELKDPSAATNARITPAPIKSNDLPIFGSPLIDIGRFGVSDLKLIATHRSE